MSKGEEYPRQEEVATGKLTYFTYFRERRFNHNQTMLKDKKVPMFGERKGEESN